MADPRWPASVAYSMGNVGLSSMLRRDAENDVYDDDFVPSSRVSTWRAFRGWLVRWSLAAGVFVAYINHWPGGQ